MIDSTDRVTSAGPWPAQVVWSGWCPMASCATARAGHHLEGWCAGAQLWMSRVVTCLGPVGSFRAAGTAFAAPGMEEVGLGSRPEPGPGGAPSGQAVSSMGGLVGLLFRLSADPAL